jgi:hypothetical protein
MKVSDDSFRCITQMTHVRHFYVDNCSAVWRRLLRSPPQGPRILRGLGPATGFY